MRSFFIISLVFLLFAGNSCQKPDTVKISEEEMTRGRPKEPDPPVSGQCNYDPDGNSIGSEWTKIFEDNFDTDLSKWVAWYGGAFNNELQLYQSANAGLSSGCLVISPVKENVTGPANPYDGTPTDFTYTSGRIESNTNFSASLSSPRVRIMARIKLPSGYGMWPAFWSYGDPWPTQGEIDILEARGQEDFKYQTNYFYGKMANRNLVRNATGTITTGTSLQSCFHVYEVIWSQNSLQFYFDGSLVKTNTGGYVSSLFGKSERITLNVAVGGNFFNNLDPALIETGDMYVDWVRVYVAD